MRKTVLLILVFGLMPAVSAGQKDSVRKGAAAKSSKYYDAAVGCIRTLMRDGTDRYGKEHSPMFSSILDLKTHSMPAEAPSLLPLQRKGDRAFPGGNLHHDIFTLLAMYHLMKITGDECYATAADAYLDFFLRCCAAVGNGLFPCGEHAFWDFNKETLGGYANQENLALVPREFWEHLWRIDPQATERHIRGLGPKCLDPIIEKFPVDKKNAVIKVFVPYNEEFQKGRTYGFWDKIYEPSGGYAFVGAEKLALMCLCAYRFIGNKDHLRYAVDVWDTYQTIDRPTDKAVTPGKYGGLVALSLDLYDITGEKKYLHYARKIADLAVDELYENGLFRAATGKDYYEAANGVGPLLIELIRLHLITSGSDYSLPRYYAET
ncbi:MAG: hypothetical protein JXM70_12190 [Pirellulales bacterium]|nr:hypothetical protein [Pirellulales bacterium]